MSINDRLVPSFCNGIQDMPELQLASSLAGNAFSGFAICPVLTSLMSVIGQSVVLAPTVPYVPRDEGPAVSEDEGSSKACEEDAST